jgi:hypothetical protein
VVSGKGGTAEVTSDVGPPGRVRLVIEDAASKSGGGGSRSCREAEAANAMASAPYGTPKRTSASGDDINLNCSGVGPVLG